MTTYSFPSVTPSSVKWGIRGNALTFRSPFSGVTQTLSRPGALWSASVTFNNLEGADRAVVTSFLASLEGGRHRFTMQNYAAPQRGILTGTPLVKGGGQTGNTLVTDGWTNSQTGIIKAGDFFAVNGELKMCTADADSGATTGPATITFTPALRTAPADNAVITVSAPAGTFMLDTNSVTWDDRPGVLTSVSFSCIEAAT